MVTGSMVDTVTSCNNCLANPGGEINVSLFSSVALNYYLYISSETTSRGYEDMFKVFMRIFHVDNAFERLIQEIVSYCRTFWRKLVEDLSFGRVHCIFP